MFDRCASKSHANVHLLGNTIKYSTPTKPTSLLDLVDKRQKPFG
ncbi:hypothetical protein [Halalkalibacterium ligniniphilum]|nr:hypothetical protein [Halalkalibacterium ligniniphilum]